MTIGVGCLETQVVGPKMPPYLGALIGMALGIPVMIFVGLELWKNLQANRQARKERQHQEAIEQVRCFALYVAGDGVV